MGIFDTGILGWGRKQAAPARPRAGRAAPATAAASTAPPAQGSRKDLLRSVLKETLAGNGIPAPWVGADLLRSTSRDRGESGIHVRLLLRHWDPRLLLHGVALEQDFHRRVIALDPAAGDWLMGISWQYAMDDLAACPPLPAPESWASPPEPVRRERRPAPVAVTVAAAQAPAAAAAEMDVIAGPVMIPSAEPATDVRADLERLFALRDEDLRRNGAERDTFAVTQPLSIEGLRREPGAT